MITCPNCAHNNPDGAVNCEACFTPLPIVKYIQCPSCNATVLSDAKFCGHCGFNLIAPSVEILPVVPIPIAIMSNPVTNQITEGEGNSELELTANSVAEVPSVPNFTDIENLMEAEVNSPSVATAPANFKTQLQVFAASLLHVQTNLTIELPVHLPVIHIGKPNTVIPPDIDVSGFSDSDIVSRIHADIRAEGGSFYLEDTGSSNGTYVNNLPLPAGNRHKLRVGDRISLGKGDKVSFVFQLSSN
jgi:hypothetical protein